VWGEGPFDIEGQPKDASSMGEDHVAGIQVKIQGEGFVGKDLSDLFF
jgi:hypothetical protein